MGLSSLEFHYYAPITNKLVAALYGSTVEVKEGALSSLKFYRVQYNWTARPNPDGFDILYACESEERAWELWAHFKAYGSHYTYLEPEELTFHGEEFTARTLQHSGGDGSGDVQVSSGRIEGTYKVLPDGRRVG